MRMDRSLQSSYRFCGTVARRQARNFYYAFLLLPPAQRRSMCALYAFLRHTDDLADEPGSAAEKFRATRRLAARARRRADGRGHGLAGSPCSGRHRGAARDTLGLLYEVIEGVLMDVQSRRFETFDDLADYCHHVASVVGLSCLPSGAIARRGERPNSSPKVTALRCN